MYLRLNDVPVPAVHGPSADETPFITTHGRHNLMHWTATNPVFVVADVEQSLTWYWDFFGFEASYVNRPSDGSPANYAVLKRNEISIHLLLYEEAPHGLSSPVQAQCLIDGDIDQLFERVKARGAAVRQPPKNQPWGHRDFMAADPDGNILWISQRL